VGSEVGIRLRSSSATHLKALRSNSSAKTHTRGSELDIYLEIQAVRPPNIFHNRLSSSPTVAAVPPKVRVGVRAFVLASSQEPHDNPRFLVGKRLNAHGAGTWALPGGHLEFGESPEQCATRELDEETGLKVKNIRYLTATNDVMKADNKHYITLFTVCAREDDTQEAEVREPHKCEVWEWWSWEELLTDVKLAEEAKEGEVLEKPLFIPFLNLVKQRPGVLPTA